MASPVAATPGSVLATGNRQQPRDSDLINSLVSTRLSLLQEMAAEKSKSAPQVQRVKELDARIKVVEEQIEHLRAQQEADVEGAAKKRAAEQSTQVYDASAILGGLPKSLLNADERAVMNELVSALSRVVKADETVTAVNGMIVVKADKEGQQNVQRTLNMLLEEAGRRMGATR